MKTNEQKIMAMIQGADVEWKTLGEVGELIRGNGLQKKDFTETGIPAIHYGQIYTYYGLFATKTKSFVSPELAITLKKVNKGDVVITNTSENLEDVGKAMLYLGEEQAVTGGHATIFKPKKEIILGKYFVYFTQSTVFANEKRKYAKGTKVIDVSANDMAKIKIPIPPLHVQAEIVRVLDAMTSLTAELTAELSMREKQYNYYRNKLLNLDKSSGGAIDWLPLGDIAEYSKTRVAAGLMNKESYIGVDNLLQNRAGKTDSNYLPNTGNLTEYTPNDILIGNIRPYLKKIWFSNQTGGTNGDVLVIRTTNDKVNPRYLYQVLADDQFFEYNMQHAKGAKMPRGNKQAIMNYSVPIPPLPQQQKIVAILDKFDALTHSITEGLPREIELRQKQYEYYREKLLGFKEDVKILEKITTL